MLLAHNITKSFGRTKALSNVGFAVPAGQAVALWGTNGAGKTTLIRCALGIIRFQGKLAIDGLDVRRRGKAVRARIGYVPQELAFHDDMRLGVAMHFFARIRSVPPQRIPELLERVNLQGHEKKRVRDLSGGMKQRLALAVALLSDPPIIVLDEPTSNLDSAARNDVMHTLQGVKREGKTILFASHRPEEVQSLADRILVLDRGRLVEDTTPAQFWIDGDTHRTIRLHVEQGLCERAAEILRSAGHQVHNNGQGLCVAVPAGAKASPFRVLSDAQVDVNDFDILDDRGA